MFLSQILTYRCTMCGVLAETLAWQDKVAVIAYIFQSKGFSARFFFFVVYSNTAYRINEVVNITHESYFMVSIVNI